MPLREVSAERAPRLSTAIGELDRVLGGGLVPGSLVLLGGSPGIGKSTLTKMALGHLAAAGRATLYVSGEESAAQIRLRAERLRARALEVPVLAETDLDTVLATLEAERPDVCVIDSVQTLHSGELERRAGHGRPGARGGDPHQRRGQAPAGPPCCSSATSPRRARSPARACSSTSSTACCSSRASASAPTARCAR